MSMQRRRKNSPRSVTCRTMPWKRPNYSFGPVFLTRGTSATAKNQAQRTAWRMQGAVPRVLIRPKASVQGRGSDSSRERTRLLEIIFLITYMYVHVYMYINLHTYTYIHTYIHTCILALS